MAWTEVPPSGHDQYFTNLKVKYLTLHPSSATSSVGTVGAKAAVGFYELAGAAARLPVDKTFIVSTGSVNYAIPAFLVSG